MNQVLSGMTSKVCSEDELQDFVSNVMTGV